MHTYQLTSSFKDRLTDLCDRSALTDSEIAKGLEVSKQTLSAWKCGTRSPKRPTIETIARYFSVPVDWLMGFDVPIAFGRYEKEKPIREDELDEDLISMLSEFSDLTVEERAQLRGYAACLRASRGASVSHSK